MYHTTSRFGEERAEHADLVEAIRHAFEYEHLVFDEDDYVVFDPDDPQLFVEPLRKQGVHLFIKDGKWTVERMKEPLVEHLESHGFETAQPHAVLLAIEKLEKEGGKKITWPLIFETVKQMKSSNPTTEDYIRRLNVIDFNVKEGALGPARHAFDLVERDFSKERVQDPMIQGRIGQTRLALIRAMEKSTASPGSTDEATPEWRMNRLGLEQGHYFTGYMSTAIDEAKDEAMKTKDVIVIQKWRPRGEKYIVVPPNFPAYERAIIDYYTKKGYNAANAMQGGILTAIGRQTTKEMMKEAMEKTPAAGGRYTECLVKIKNSTRTEDIYKVRDELKQEFVKGDMTLDDWNVIDKSIGERLDELRRRK
jgi:hypothetical protein